MKTSRTVESMTLDVLIKAEELIRKGWVQDISAADKNGEEVE